LISEIRHQVICLMRDKGVFDNEYDELLEQSPLLVACYQASVRNRIALGERAGQRVERLAERLRIERDLNRVERRGKLHAHHDGFDLHAEQRIHQNDREQLERTMRYCARPPASVIRYGLNPESESIAEAVCTSKPMYLVMGVSFLRWF